MRLFWFVVIVLVPTLLPPRVLHAGEPRGDSAAERNARIDESVFHDNFDMNGNYSAHVLRVKNMRVWDEQSNGYSVRYWGPTQTGVEGEMVLRYRFERPVVEASIACNLLPNGPTDRVALEVSPDDETYTILTEDRLHPSVDPPHRSTRFDVTRHVAGSREVYLRVRLIGTQLNTSIMSAQFLRTAVGLPFFNAPHVYDFRAKLAGE